MNNEDIKQLITDITAPYKTIAFWILFMMCIQCMLFGAMLAFIYFNR